MADLSAVEQALAALVGGIVYPTPGTSITGSVVKIYRGWPAPEALNNDLGAGTCNVSIYSLPGGSRNVSRYSRDWQQVAAPAAPTLTASASGNTVTFGGTAAAGQLAALAAERIGWVHAVQATDTPATVTAALAAAVNADGRLQATTSGATVSVTDPLGAATPASGYTAGTGTAFRETRRQEQRILVTVWCPMPPLRDTLASAIDNALSGVDWLDTSDPTLTRLRYVGTAESDGGVNASLFRRDLTLLAEFPTIQFQTSAPVIFPIGLLHALGVDITTGTGSPISGVLSADGGATIETDAAGNVLVQPSP